MFSLTNLMFLILTLTLFFFLIKKFYRVKFGTSVFLNAKDLIYITVLAVVSLSATHYIPPVIPVLVLSLLLLVVWLDALLMYSFGMKVTISNIRTFLQGVSTFKGESEDVMGVVKRFHWVSAACLFILSAVIYALSGLSELSGSVLLSLSVTSLAFAFSKSRIKNVSLGIVWLVVWALIAWGISYATSVESIWLSALMGAVVVLVFALSLRKEGAAFWKGQSVMSGLLKGNTLKPGKTSPNNEALLNAVLAENSEKKDLQAPLHGIAKGSSILMFTIESLSDEAYCDSPWGRKIESLLSGKIDAERAYSVCPNTNQSLYQLYSSCYGEKGSFSHLQKMKEAGYTTTFMTTQETKFFNMNTLLRSAGFDRVLDEIKSPDAPIDYALAEQLPEIEKLLGEGPAFIQVLNTQTHSKYSVVEKDRFNRYSNSQDKGRYFNAVDESLSIVYGMLQKLKDKGLLENTIVVMAGDHGQSFGEYGYFAHSSSTVNQQVCIPLKLFHPAFPDTTVEQASLLDLMPTLLDLTGIEREKISIDGVNFLSGKPPYLLLYSDTKGANSPSNISLLLAGKKYYVDLIQFRYQVLDLEDEADKGASLNRAEIEKIVYTAAQKHGLIW